MVVVPSNNQQTQPSSPTANYNCASLRIVLVGDTGVGKSCLLLRFVDDTFAESYISTIGVDFRFRALQINNLPTRLQIWDTAGQERFRTITSAYYRGADGIIIVYDPTNRTSFDNVKSWHTEVEQQGNGAAIMLVASKSDAPNKVVSTEEGQQKAKELNLLFAETSAKDRSNVDLPFTMLASEILKKTPPKKPTGARRIDSGRSNSRSESNWCC